MGQRWFERLFYRIFSLLIPWAIRRWYLQGVTGLELLPRHGPFLLVANHSSSFDHLLIGATIRISHNEKVFFLAKRKFFRRPLQRLWCNSMGAIPVEPDKLNVGSYRATLTLLERAGVVCVYPEGAINSGNEMLPFKPGAFRIAAHQSVPIIPVGVNGSQAILPKGAIWPRRARAFLAFGSALAPIRGDDAERRILDQCRESISSLIGETMQPALRRDAQAATAAFLRRKANSIQQRAVEVTDVWVRARLRFQARRILKLAKVNDPQSD